MAVREGSCLPFLLLTLYPLHRIRQKVGLKETNMLVDFMKRCYTPLHPCAAEAMVDGVIRPGSLTIHMNLTRVGVSKA
eukprot:28523-Eustigmatos_ZCMA.PRE.1